MWTERLVYIRGVAARTADARTADAPALTTFAAPAAAAAPARSAAAAAPARLLSLDVLRGVAVAAMVLVNNPGRREDAWLPLQHVAWNGWGLTETVAPGFLWIVGVGIALAGTPKPIAVVARRAAVLFALGLVIMATPQVVPLLQLDALATLRVPGTLQRIALCLFAATVLHRWFGARTLAALVVALLAGYWAAMLLVPLPAHVPGVIAPGDNLAAVIDHAVFGRHAKPSDPLGLLSTVPAVATTLLGVLTGRWLRARGGERAATADTSARLLAAGALLAAAGQILQAWIPVNESLWTPSYVLLMAGLATLAFGACHWLLDVRGARAWSAPFVTLGREALVVFFVSQVLQNLVGGIGVPAFGRPWVSLRGIVYEAVYLRVGAPALASFLYALTWVLGFYLLARWLDRKRWYLKV